MEYRKLLFVCFVFVIVFILSCESAMALNTGFKTDCVDENDKQIFISNIDLSLIREEPEKNAITCFDISESGLIAVGTKNLNKKLVMVYTSDGHFEYGYEFNYSGSFGIEWDDDNIIIYFVRSDIAASFDKAGDNVELKKIQKTIENTSYWNNNVFCTQRTINNSLYYMNNENVLFSIAIPSYSQITKVDSNGNSEIIYTCGNNQVIKFVMVFIIIVVFVVLAIRIVFLQFIKLTKEIK